MTSGVNTANLIPGDNVANSLGDLKVAVWANPGFSVFGIRPDTRLGRVFDSPFDFRTTKAQAKGI
jgi:hypothetical protein